MRPTDVSVTTGARKATRISISGEDILLEILLRQPLKSLVRFRCVSKQWLSLIDGPYFSHRRYPNSNTDPPAALLLCPTARLRCPYRQDQPQSIAEPPLVFSPINPHEPIITLSSLSFVNPSSPRFYICSSCNGLLLVAAATFPAEAQLQNYFVINPTTREFKKLPQLELVGGGRRKIPKGPSYIGMSLAFDPKSGISPDEFKVICIMRTTTNRYYEPEHTVYRISIYSSVTKEWKVSGSAGFSPINRNLEGVQLDWSVFCKGAIHWYSYSEQSLYLDVENESLRIMDMPKGSTGRTRYFGASRGRLHIIDNFCPHDGTKLKLYEMRSDCSGWVAKHQIQLEGVIAQFPYHSWSTANNFFCINSFVRGEQGNDDHGREEEEEEEGGFLVVQIPHCQIRYNLKDGSYAKIFKLPPVADDWKHYDFIRYGWFDVFPYFASLARLN